jgi:ceramide glucosyltransferase
MRARPDYLRRIVAPLADPQVGLVTCAYRGEQALTLTARLEALHMGAVFLPSVLVARQVLHMRFALGATMALRKSDLARAGGFAAVTEWLADDFQIAARIAGLGLQVRLCDYVIASVLGATTFREQWQREVRWARCNRVNQSLGYAGYLITFSTPLSLITVLAVGTSPATLAALGGSLLLRWGVAWVVSGYTGDHETRRWLALLPLRDLLSALMWGVGAFGRRIWWRGVEYEVEPDGRLRAIAGTVLSHGAHEVNR